MNGFDKVKEKIGNILLQKPTFHRGIFKGMVSEIPISSKGPKGDRAQFLQDVERNSVYFAKFKPGYSMYIGPGSEETCTFERYPANPQGK